MVRKRSLTYETRTPDLSQAESARPGATPGMQLHSWFDHTRNVMVVEVRQQAAPPDSQTASQEQASESKSSSCGKAA